MTQAAITALSGGVIVTGAAAAKIIKYLTIIFLLLVPGIFLGSYLLLTTTLWDRCCYLHKQVEKWKLVAHQQCAGGRCVTTQSSSSPDSTVLSTQPAPPPEASNTVCHNLCYLVGTNTSTTLVGPLACFSP